MQSQPVELHHAMNQTISGTQHAAICEASNEFERILDITKKSLQCGVGCVEKQLCKAHLLSVYIRNNIA